MKNQATIVTLNNAIQNICNRFKTAKQQPDTSTRVTSADIRAYRHYLSNYQRQHSQ